MQSNREQSARSGSAEEKKERIKKLRESLKSTKSVGEPEELVPFAWRYPLLPTQKNASKVYRELVDREIKK